MELQTHLGALLTLVALWSLHPSLAFREVEPLTFESNTGFTYLTCPKHICGAGGTCRPKSDLKEYIPCYCDVYCELLHDCCLEHSRCTFGADVVLLVANEVMQYKEYYGCTEIGYTSVIKCPKSVTGYLKSACEDEQPCDIYKRIPVVADGVIFKNLYCAHCHELGFSNITKWRIQISKDDVDDVTLSTVFKMIFGKMNLGENVRYGICTKFVAVPAEPKNYFQRPCSHNAYKYNSLEKVNAGNIVSTCDTRLRFSLKDYSEIDHECLVLSADVYARIPHNTGTVRFKNMFCAKCNGIKESDLFCPPRDTMTHPPKVELDLYSQNSRYDTVPDQLDDLTNDAGVGPCDPGKFFNLNANTCDALSRCDVGHVQWNTRCIRDPFDKVYAPPIVGSGEGSVHLDIKIFPTFMTALSETEIENGEFWSASLLPAIVEFLYMDRYNYFARNIGYINVTLDASFAESEIELSDGREIHFGPNTTFQAYIRHEKMSFQDVQNLAHNLQSFNEKNDQQVAVGYEVFSKDVLYPVQCEEGTLVYLRNTTDIRRYFNSMRGGVDLNDLVWMRNTTDTYIVTCDRFTAKFSNCEVKNQSLDKFELTSGDLKFKVTGKSVGEHVIIGNYVYGCFESMKRGQGLSRNLITVIGLCLSLLFLSFTLLTYCVFTKLRTMPGWLLLNLCATLICSQLLFLTVIYKDFDPRDCETIAIVLHFFGLSTYLWMNVIAFNMMWVFTMTASAFLDSRPGYKTLLLYAIYAYGVPACVVTGCQTLESFGWFSVGYGPTKGYMKPKCWLNERDGILYTLMVPIGLLNISDIVFFTVTSFPIYWTRKLVHQAKKDPRNRREFVLYIRLFALMGFTWVSGFVGVFYEHVVIWCLYDVFYSLTGVYIGLGFAFNKRVLSMWKGRGNEAASGEQQHLPISTDRLAPSASGENRISLAISTSTPLTLKFDGPVMNDLAPQKGTLQV